MPSENGRIHLEAKTRKLLVSINCIEKNRNWR